VHVGSGSSGLGPRFETLSTLDDEIDDQKVSCCKQLPMIYFAIRARSAGDMLSVDSSSTSAPSSGRNVSSEESLG
jgi:hypothetical protein